MAPEINILDILNEIDEDHSYVWGCPHCKTGAMEIDSDHEWVCLDCKQIIANKEVIELTTLPSELYNRLVSSYKAYLSGGSDAS